MNVYTSNAPGELIRAAQLDAYFQANVLRCGNLESCRLSAQLKGHCFSAVQLPHVGELYDIKRNGRPWRIVVCGQEAGGPKGDESILKRSPRMSHWGRTVSFAGRNPHMQGTTNALRLLFGLPLSSEAEDDYIDVDGERRHVFDAFCLINALSCSATAAATGKNGKATREMKRNCVEHLRATVQILCPTVLVVQGNIARGMLAEAFPDLEQSRPTLGLIPSLGTAVAMLAHPSARPDPRRGARARMDWADLTSPYLREDVAPLLAGLSRRLVAEAA
jgi:uracil-DNA glycosylase